MVAIIDASEKERVLYTVWKPVSSMTYITMAARYLKELSKIVAV